MHCACIKHNDRGFVDQQEMVPERHRYNSAVFIIGCQWTRTNSQAKPFKTFYHCIVFFMVFEVPTTCKGFLRTPPLNPQLNIRNEPGRKGRNGPVAAGMPQ
jgi:hypothetical protein